MSRVLTIALSFLTIGLGRQLSAQGENHIDGFQFVDKGGNIRKPTNVRDTYQSLGTFMIADPKGDQMHFTYASPGTAEAYRRTGHFPDGTVLVKEVFGTQHASMSTGNVSWGSDTKIWFVLIKDAKGRYAGNPLWGDGWGWALFKADSPDKQVATDYKKDCLGCHVPAKSTDCIYVQGYPVLKSK